jgi:prepilin-type N-terminal cleavage/methylation domain-containing protein
MVLISSKNQSRSSGFTLVELLVAIALFSILVAIAAGGFVRALRTEREVASMMSAESNISIALEEMTREMRTGYLFCHDPGSNAQSDACGGVSQQLGGDNVVITDCTSDNAAVPTWTCRNGVEFYNASHDKIDYVLRDGVLERGDSSENGGALSPLTSSNVSTTYLNFTLFGNLETDPQSNATDTWNPRVTIAVGVEPNDNTVSWSAANLETSVSGRAFDSAPQQ